MVYQDDNIINVDNVTYISESALASVFNKPKTWLANLRRTYDAPCHRMHRKIYYNYDAFLEWYNETVFISPRFLYS